MQLRPTPSVTGTVVETDTTGWFGTFSTSTTNVVSFECDGSTGIYGTIGGCDSGDVFIDCPGGMFGIPGDVQVSTGNLMASTLNDQYYSIDSLEQYIDVIPNSFEFFILAGILARLYSMDGEMKNPEMAKYWTARYKEGINMVRAISGEVSLEDKKK